MTYRDFGADATLCRCSAISYGVIANKMRADDAVRTDESVALPAMSAIERRLVHEYLRDRRDVETFSEGEEPDRHLVVSPVVD